jgi:hypothetical protein
MVIFDSFDKFEAAKQALILNKGNAQKAYEKIKEDGKLLESSDNSSLVIDELQTINEGLKDTILNFVSDKIGGDIRKIKTSLDQMKEQELKFNKEEFDIYKEFHSLVKKQKALEKDRSNPDRDELIKSVSSAREALKMRLKKLTQSHDEIFNALEEKIKSLTKDNSRKKKYFNAQRASDVIVTSTDRYTKGKELAKLAKDDVDELEKFFGLNIDKMGGDIEKAREAARKSEEELKKAAEIVSGETDMIDFFTKKFNTIKTSKGSIESAVKKLDALYNQVVEEMSAGEYSPDQIKKFQDLNEENEKLMKFLLKVKDAGKVKMEEIKVK